MKEIKNNRYEWIILMLLMSMALCLGGMCCNFNAVMDNGGRMPVLNGIIENNKYFYYYENDDVNWSFLTDRFGISIKGGEWKFSIGDVLMTSGLTLLAGTVTYQHVHFVKEKK